MIELRVPKGEYLLLKAASEFFGRAAACAKPEKEPLNGTVVREATTTASPGVVSGGSCTEGAIAGGIAAGAGAGESLFAGGDAENGAELDQKGVAFNADFCGVSADKPFYGPGPKLGQWKKKRGVEEGEYNIWYAQQVTASTAPVKEEAGTVEALAANTAAASAGAFGPLETATTAGAAKVPTTGVELIGWTAERQAAKQMDAETLTAAFTQCNVTQGQLFAPNSGAQVAAVYQLLVSWGIPA
jgi:hypothetical protein